MSFLFSLYFIAHLVVTFFVAKYGKSSKGFFAVACYSIITSAIAIIFFLIATGFSPLINKITVIYAAILTVAVIGSHYFGLLIYRHMNILNAGMIKSSLSLILTFFVGARLYGETISSVSVARMLLAMGSTILLVLHQRKKEEGEIKRSTTIGYVLCAALILLDVLFTIGIKEFATLSVPHDESSCFLLVNVFCFVFSIVVCVILKKGNPVKILHELRDIGIRNYGYIVLITIGSNVESLSTTWIHAMKNSVVLFVPLTAAIGVIVQVIVSKVLGKEKIPKMAVGLSMLSAILAFIG